MSLDTTVRKNERTHTVMSGFPAELNRNYCASIAWTGLKNSISCEKPIENPTSAESSNDNMKVTTLEFWIHEMDAI